MMAWCPTCGEPVLTEFLYAHCQREQRIELERLARASTSQPGDADLTDDEIAWLVGTGKWTINRARRARGFAPADGQL